MLGELDGDPSRYERARVEPDPQPCAVAAIARATASVGGVRGLRDAGEEVPVPAMSVADGGVRRRAAGAVGCEARRVSENEYTIVALCPECRAVRGAAMEDPAYASDIGKWTLLGYVIERWTLAQVRGGTWRHTVACSKPRGAA